MRRIYVSKKDEVNYELLKEKIKQVLEKNGTILDRDLYDDSATNLEKIQVNKKIVSFVIPDLPEKEKEEVENSTIKRRRRTKKMTKSSGSKNACLDSTTAGSGSVNSKTGSRNSIKEKDATNPADSNGKISSKKRRERKPEIFLEPPTPPEVETMVSQVPHSSDSEQDDKGRYLKVPIFRRNRSRTTSLNSNYVVTVPIRKRSPMDSRTTVIRKENPKPSTLDEKNTMDSKSKLIPTRKKKKKKTNETKLESSLTKTECDKIDIKPEETIPQSHSSKIDQGQTHQDKSNGTINKSKRKDLSKKKYRLTDDSKAAGNSDKHEILNKTVPRDQPNDVNLTSDNKPEVVFQKIDSQNGMKEDDGLAISVRPRSKGKREKATKITAKEDKDDESILCNLAYKKMIENGCAIKLSTLQRGLLTPTEIKKISRHRNK